MNKFQSETLKKIFKRFPEWRSISNTTANPYGEEDIVFEIPCPSNSEKKLQLRVIVQKDEIIVLFDAFHSHFVVWDDPEPFSSAQSFVEDIFNENIAIISWWDNDKWEGSSCFYPKKGGPNPRHISKFNKQIIRSWNGTHNNEIIGPKLKYS